MANPVAAMQMVGNLIFADLSRRAFQLTLEKIAVLVRNLLGTGSSLTTTGSTSQGIRKVTPGDFLIIHRHIKSLDIEFKLRAIDLLLAAIEAKLQGNNNSQEDNDGGGNGTCKGASTSLPSTGNNAQGSEVILMVVKGIHETASALHRALETLWDDMQQHGRKWFWEYRSFAFKDALDNISTLHHQLMDRFDLLNKVSLCLLSTTTMVIQSSSGHCPKGHGSNDRLLLAPKEDDVTTIDPLSLKDIEAREATTMMTTTPTLKRFKSSLPVSSF